MVGRGEAQPSAQPAAWKMCWEDRELRVVFANLVVYGLVTNLQGPQLPALTQAFGAGPQAYGLMMSISSLSQLVGGLLCGPLMDVWGARWGMSLAFASGGIGYAMTAAATSMPLLHLSRVPMAFQHAALAARVAISVRARPVDQPAMLGYIGLAYTFGAIAGSSLGGTLAEFSLAAPSIVAAGLSAACAASVLLLLPPPGRRPASQRVSTRSKLSAASFARVASLPGVRPLLAVKTVFSLVLALFHGVFALAASTHFGLSPAFTGALLSGMAVVTMLTQAFLIDWVTRSFDTAQVYRANVLTLALSFAGIALSTSIVGVVLSVVPMTIASSILFTANTAQLNKAASPGDRGTLNAIDMSVSSFVRVFSPSLGTWILRTQGFSAIGAIGALTLALLFLAIELSRSIVVRPGLELGTGL